MQIFVLGMHRSGTSALARLLNLMGAYFGGENVGTGRNVENRKGFWERRDVRLLNDTILFNSGCDWDRISSLDFDKLDGRDALEDAAADIVLNLDAHRPWFVKEPRLCVLFPIWRKALELPFCIHIHRNPLEVAHSLKARNGIPIRAGLALWEFYNTRALAASAALPRVFVGFEELLEEPADTVSRIHSALSAQGVPGLRVPSNQELLAFLDPALRKQRRSLRAFRSAATASQFQLYELLLDAADSNSFATPALPQKCLDQLRDYERTFSLDNRKAQANARKRSRNEQNLELRLALNRLELSHAETQKQDLAARTRSLEKEIVLRQRSETDLKIQLAVAHQQSKTLKRELNVLERQREDLRQRNQDLGAQFEEQHKRNHDLERQHDKLGQRNKDLSRHRADLIRQCADLSKQHADLSKQHAGLSKQHADLSGQHDNVKRLQVDLEKQHRDLQRNGTELARQHNKLKESQVALRSDIRQAAQSLAARRADALATIRQWDDRLIQLKDRRANLSRLERQLAHDIGTLMESRRWRVGEMVIAIGTRALRRKSRNTIPDRLSKGNETYRAKRLSCRDGAAKIAESIDDLTGMLPSHSTTLEKLAGFSPSRDEQVTIYLLQRRFQLSQLEREVEILDAHLDCLASVGDALLKSRRWRLGDWVASFPYRLVLRPRPPTVAASLSRHIQNYRFDMESRTVDHATEPTGVKRSDATGLRAPSAVNTTPRPQVNIPTTDTEQPDDSDLAGSTVPATAALSIEPDVCVDIVVCVHNALDDVRRCLHSITAKTTVDFHLIVINDGSNVETTQWLRRFTAATPNAELFETGEPTGYTGAANRGLRTSTAEYVVLLNSDTIVGRLWLEGLLDCMYSGEDLGIVGPVSNAATWQSIPERFGSEGNWAVNHLPPGYNVDEFSELVRLKSARRFPQADFLNGFCLMIGRKVLERVGYLDEEAFPKGYGEENDYCIRARDAGFKLAVADHCYIYHAKSRSFGSATRDILSARGRETLQSKYGIERIQHGTERLRNSTALSELRRAVAESLATANAAVHAQTAMDSPVAEPTPTGPGKILFVLPAKGGSGGANSVVQEVAGMRKLGVDAKAATHERYRDRFRHFYREFFESENYFLFFDSDEELMALSSPFDVIVATLWSTPAQIAPIARRLPNKTFFYYVQDYEPWFFPNDPDLQSEAAESYNLIPDMALMAKTDWICRTVRERHGCDVYRVAPSLDHDVFYPSAKGSIDKEEVVTIAAMIRPSTPRRAPIRTLAVLREVVKRRANKEALRVVVFGCETADLNAYVKRHDTELSLDFPFENRGLLTRNEVAELLREADIFLDLSDYQAFGRTGLESMACGCATVLTAHGGAYEYALDGDNTLLVDVTSFNEVVTAVERLLNNAGLRRQIQSRALETAARYSILRASLSELSVFELVTTLRRRKRLVSAPSFRRGIEPAAMLPAAVSISVLGLTRANGNRKPFSNRETRVLRPLRQACLRDRVEVSEALSLASLCQQDPDICIVPCDSVEQLTTAHQLVETCAKAGIKLIYETDELPNARASAEAAVRVLVEAADRVVVSTAGLRDGYQRLNPAVTVLPAALDQVLWMEDSVPGERLLDARRSPDRMNLISIADGTELKFVASGWPEILEATQKPTSLQGYGYFDGVPPAGWQFASNVNESLEQFVLRLRTDNRWDLALLPANASAADADLRFLVYAALGLTIVCSDQGPHTAFARHEENAIVVGNSSSEWRDGVTRAIQDTKLRESLRARALYDIDTKYSLGRRAIEYLEAYCGVLK